MVVYILTCLSIYAKAGVTGRHENWSLYWVASEKGWKPPRRCTRLPFATESSSWS